MLAKKIRESIASFLLYMLPAMAAGQSASEIYLLDMSVSKDKIILSNPRAISNHKGYNNQPSFHNSLPLLYYASFDDSGRSDIKYYNYATQQTKNLTVTPEREYSPALTPDNQHISCVIQRDNGQQDLGEYPMKGGPLIVLINNLEIGYYGWLSDSTLLLFVLTGRSFELHYFNLKTKQDSLLSLKPGRCFVKVPGENAMSFIDKTDSAKWSVKKLNVATGKIETITDFTGLNEDFTWTTNGLLIAGRGSALFFCNPREHPGLWEPIKLPNGTGSMKKITRLAANTGNDRLAIVADQ